MFKLKFKKLHPDAKAPSRAHRTDLGFDVYSIEDYTLEPGEQYRFDLGIAIELPSYIVMGNVLVPTHNDSETDVLIPHDILLSPGLLFWDKSSIGNKEVKVMGGVIEATFRDEISVMLKNLSDKPVTFTKGQKLTQMLVTPIILCEAEEVDELSDTERSTGGFGSTGTH